MENIGILANPIKKRFYGESDEFYKDLIKKGHKIGLNVFVFNEKDINFSKKTINANFIKANKNWIRKKTKFPKVVYDRAIKLSIGFRRRLEKQGIKIINPRELAGLSVDKFKTYNVLYNNGFKLKTNPKQPETMLYSHTNLKKMLKKYNKIFLKPRFGSMGRGVMEIIKKDSKHILKPGNKVLTSKNLKILNNKLSKNYIIEEAVEIKKYKNSVFDIRVLVQRGNKSKISATEMVARVAGKGKIVANIHRGGTSVKVNKLITDLFGKSVSKNIEKKIKQTSIKIFKIIEKEIKKQLCELAVDLMIDKKGKIYVIEINSKPGRIFKALSANSINKSIQRPMEYAAYLASKK